MEILPSAIELKGENNLHIRLILININDSSSKF